ncbi:LysR substrate-binding domain-containing protein [Niveibacterium terrae]|uniref:LysR family transcriptional regulator n=1 Tax=Niveibacterium terrae TaxID=3373598 RepID=UPI003A92AE8C
MRFENIEEPRVFVETARRGSLSAAARALQITPAAASAALKKLEARLGVRLFERTTRSLRITSEGEVLLGYCERALSLLDEGATALAEASGTLSGRLRVTAPSDLVRRTMLPMLDGFLDAHPGVELMLSVGDAVQDVVRDQVDVALRYGEPRDSRLVALPIAEACRSAVASPAYLAERGTPLHPEDLAGHECLSFVIRQRRQQLWPFWPEGGGDALKVRVGGRRTADDGGIVQRWAIEGRGIAYKSELDTAEALASGALVRLFPAWRGESVPLNAILPSNRFIPARARALVKHLQQSFAALVA